MDIISYFLYYNIIVLCIYGLDKIMSLTPLLYSRAFPPFVFGQ
jgi:hypothetical protein